MLKPTGNNPELFRKELLLRSRKDFIERNFDRHLDKLMHETMAWKMLVPFGVMIPNYADEFTTVYKENLRILKECVMLVVRD